MAWNRFVIKSIPESETWEEDMFWSNDVGWTSNIEDALCFSIGIDDYWDERVLMFCEGNEAILVHVPREQE
jgi:hypothetical protein